MLTSRLLGFEWEIWMLRGKPYRHCSECWAGLSVLWTRSPLSSLFVARKVRNASWSSSSCSYRWTRSPVENTRSVYFLFFFSENEKMTFVLLCSLHESCHDINGLSCSCFFQNLVELNWDWLNVYNFYKDLPVLSSLAALTLCQRAKFGAHYTKTPEDKSAIKSERSQN